MRRFDIYVILHIIFAVHSVSAQPANDNCENAIEIVNLMGCSAAGAFSNENATPGGLDAPSCFSGANNDVWFSFVAIATDATVTITGAALQGANGTLENPEVSMYVTADCIQFNEIQCESDATGAGLVELYKGGLQVGVRYYLRVQGRGGRTGTFQLCLDNYNQPVQPGSDCIISSILCDKSTFVVQQVTGAGNDPDEAGNSSCLGGFQGNSESNSTWFTWIARTSGALTFTLTPLNASDDLDFILYELPNGVTDCSRKRELRCMASGDFSFPSPCMGPTGLREGESDSSEPAGCNDPSQNNFLAPVDMVQGRGYALLVNNFSSTGNGFRIEFDGAGTFVGPEPEFNVSSSSLEVCVGEPITFNDASSFALGDIVGWEWKFGEDALPTEATGRGPHQVFYSKPGVKTAVLVVESDRGCRVTEIDLSVIVKCCGIDMDVMADITDIQCIDDTNGAIDLTVNGSSPSYDFDWSTGDMTEDLNNLGMGDYSVVIAEESTCDTTLVFTVGGPDSIRIDPQITRPSCDGGTNGMITLVATGGNPPYEYDFGSGFSTSNVLANLAEGDYTVVIRDNENCEKEEIIAVRELVLELDPTAQSTTPPSCFGDADASITIRVTNGTPPYQYDFNDGNGFTNSNTKTGLSAGSYTVNVLDANRCSGSFLFLIQDPAPLSTVATGIDISCSGEQDGRVSTITTGGTGDYSYIWNNGQTTSVLDGLQEGLYIVTVTDINNCVAVDTVGIAEPDELNAAILELVDARCAGDLSGQITATGTGGTPPYMYSIDGFIFNPSQEITGLGAGNYMVVVKDARDCLADIDTSIAEPAVLSVELGEDIVVTLGDQIRLDAQVSPSNRKVTYAFSGVDSLDCTNCPTPSIRPTNSSTYTVVVTDENGCIATDNINILVDKPRPIYIPTVFSPNGDGFNDYFYLYGNRSAERILSFVIYDRWGELMYKGENLPLGDEQLGWNGKFLGQTMQPGVFTYTAEVEFIDGEVVLYSGDVTLLQ